MEMSPLVQAMMKIGLMLLCQGKGRKILEELLQCQETEMIL